MSAGRGFWPLSEHQRYTPVKPIFLREVYLKMQDAMPMHDPKPVYNRRFALRRAFRENQRSKHRHRTAVAAI